jgi:hypothetical protein
MDPFSLIILGAAVSFGMKLFSDCAEAAGTVLEIRKTRRAIAEVLGSEFEVGRLQLVASNKEEKEFMSALLHGGNIKLSDFERLFFPMLYRAYEVSHLAPKDEQMMTDLGAQVLERRLMNRLMN